MHVCLTIPSLSRAGGGTVAVVQNLSEHLALLADSVTVMALATESGAAEALPRSGSVEAVHIAAKVKLGSANEIRKILRERLVQKKVQVVHNFGLWQPFNHAVVLACKDLSIPLVASPSGMLAPWALRHKAWKKRLGWWLYQRQDLLRAALLVATAGQEMQDIGRLMPGKPIALVPNGVEIPEINSQMSDVRCRRPVGEPKTAVFLGRIHPVKGLMNLVEAWSRVRPAGWQCILAGPEEAGHRQELETLLRSYNLEHVFHFPGLMEDGQKLDLLNAADIFVLPSFTENFGIVVAEALAAGVPVITTKGTPWADLVDRRCGWWIDIGMEPLADALRKAMSLSDQERQEMGQRGRRLVEEKFSWPTIGRQMKEAYEWVLGAGKKPDCICDA